MLRRWHTQSIAVEPLWGQESSCLINSDIWMVFCSIYPDGLSLYILGSDVRGRLQLLWRGSAGRYRRWARWRASSFHRGHLHIDKSLHVLGILCIQEHSRLMSPTRSCMGKASQSLRDRRLSLGPGLLLGQHQPVLCFHEPQLDLQVRERPPAIDLTRAYKREACHHSPSYIVFISVLIIS